MKDTRLRNAAVSFVIIVAFGGAYYFSTVQTPPPAESLIAWKSFDEGVTLAKQTNKKLLVDVYTNWCTWCKKMDSEVYTNKNVVKLINEHFVASKLNAESSKEIFYKGKKLDESELARELGTTGYPTTIFFDQQSEPITSLPGYSPPENFVNVLGFIGQDYYKTISYQQYITQTAPAR